MVIDSLGRFLPPGAENSASLLFDALAPLASLAQTGVAVLLIHHPSIAPAAEGMAQWPADFTSPKESTLWTWIDEAHKRGLILHEGTGRRRDSYRYYLPEKMLAWKDDPMYTFEKLMRESAKKVLSSLR